MELSFPSDFFAFLKLLNEHQVEYLLIGGYAVGFHGYPRVTGDMDVWIRRSADTAARMIRVFRDFGFVDGVDEELFLRERGIVRLGVLPNRLEVTTHIDGVDFQECYVRRVEADVKGLRVPLIDLADLRANKRASGRLKDLLDLENLPEA
ncbi:MAG: hypothetical protein HY319_27165 [Armatimonadetes bacterium]|nr:hypothetical protein [Armatimonadota bacterium]